MSITNAPESWTCEGRTFLEAFTALLNGTAEYIRRAHWGTWISLEVAETEVFSIGEVTARDWVVMGPMQHPPSDTHDTINPEMAGAIIDVIWQAHHNMPHHHIAEPDLHEWMLEIHRKTLEIHHAVLRDDPEINDGSSVRAEMVQLAAQLILYIQHVQPITIAPSEAFSMVMTQMRKTIDAQVAEWKGLLKENE